MTVLVMVAVPDIWSGGLVDEDLKSAVKLEEKGEYSRAAESYARVLRLEPGNKKAKTGLGRVAGGAITEKLSLARKYEDSLRFTDAHAELIVAVAIQDRARSAGVDLTSDTDAAEAMERMIDRWVDTLYDEAIRAQTDELWSAAVAHLRRIEALRPAHLDVRPRLAEVWTSWGFRELELRMYRSAAGRFIEASMVPGFAGGPAARNAAEMLARIGDHALERGACRSAVRDLRSAVELAGDIVQPDALVTAEACSLTCLTLAVAADRDLEMETTRVEQIGAEIRRLLVNRGSSFLVVTRQGSPQTSPCDSRSSNGTSDAAVPAAPRRIRSTVEVTSKVILRSPATSRNSEYRSSQMIGGQIVGESVTVVRVYDEVFVGAMTGTITLADQRTGRTSQAIPVRIEGQTTAQWVKNPATAVSIGTADRSTRIDGGPGLSRLANIDGQRFEARTRLKDALAQDFVVEVARIILETVDAEPGISDPLSLELSFVSAPGR